jgi:hypothetical protein
VGRGKKRKTGNTKEMLRINGLDFLNRKIMARRNIMNRITRQPRKSGHWLNIRLSSRTLGSINHLSTIRRNVEVVEIGPNGTRREKGFRGNDRSEPHVKKRRIGRKEVTHISLRHVVTRVAKENRRSRNRRERKRRVRNRLGGIAEKVLGSQDGINESEPRGLIRSVCRIGKVELAICGIFARNNGGGVTENIRDRIVHHGVLNGTMEGMSGILRRRGRIIDTDGLGELGDGASKVVRTKGTNFITLNDGSIHPSRLLLGHTLSGGDMGNSSIIGRNGDQTSGLGSESSDEIWKERDGMISGKNEFRIIKLKNGSEKGFPGIIERIQRRRGGTVENMKIVIRISIPHDTNKIRWTGLEHLSGTIEIIKSIADGRRSHGGTRKSRGTMSPRTR